MMLKVKGLVISSASLLALMTKIQLAFSLSSSVPEIIPVSLEIFKLGIQAWSSQSLFSKSIEYERVNLVNLMPNAESYTFLPR